MAPFKVAIVGAGLAGSLLANGLLLHEIDLTVYERDSRPGWHIEGELNAMYQGKKREGYQIRLGASALVGFKACLTQKQFDDCIKLFGRSGGLVSAAPVIYDSQFRVLQDLTKFPAYTKSAPINRVVLRDFLQESLDNAGKIQYRKHFDRYEVVETGDLKPSKIRLHFRDGSTGEADILISAEGSGSKINSQVGLGNIIQLKETVGFLAKGRLSPDKLRDLPKEVLKGPITCIKDEKILFFSVYLPPAKSSTNEQDTAMYDEYSASLFWALNVPVKCFPSGSIENVEDKTGFCLKQIADWHPKYRTLLSAANDDDVYMFQPYASKKPSKDWREKASKSGEAAKGHCRVFLMGDSIHPMLPGRGMGGNQAMHDAADLLQHIIPLARLAQSGNPVNDSDVRAAVRSYETCMVPRAFYWVEQSGGLGRKFADPESFQGRIAMFIIGIVLRVAYVSMALKRLFLKTATNDDALELPD